MSIAAASSLPPVLPDISTATRAADSLLSSAITDEGIAAEAAIDAGPAWTQYASAAAALRLLLPGAAGTGMAKIASDAMLQGPTGAPRTSRPAWARAETPALRQDAFRDTQFDLFAQQLRVLLINRAGRSPAQVERALAQVMETIRVYNERALGERSAGTSKYFTVTVLADIFFRAGAAHRIDPEQLKSIAGLIPVQAAQRLIADRVSAPPYLHRAEAEFPAGEQPTPFPEPPAWLGLKDEAARTQWTESQRRRNNPTLPEALADLEWQQGMLAENLAQRGMPVADRGNAADEKAFDQARQDVEAYGTLILLGQRASPAAQQFERKYHEALLPVYQQEHLDRKEAEQMANELEALIDGNMQPWPTDTGPLPHAQAWAETTRVFDKFEKYARRVAELALRLPAP